MRGISFLVLCLAAVGFAATGGCNSTASNSQNSPEEVEGHDHDHDGHEGDHDGHEEHEHDGDEHAHHGHGTLGPHGGHLIELGDDAYHAELVHQEDTDQLILYLLDGQAAERATVRVDEATLNLIIDGKPAQYELAALPFENETEDRCSRFAATDAQLVDCFCHDEQIHGRLNLIIAGKTYVGIIKHRGHGEQSAHDHHDHDHDAHRGADGELKRR